MRLTLTDVIDSLERKNNILYSNVIKTFLEDLLCEFMEHMEFGELDVTCDIREEQIGEREVCSTTSFYEQLILDDTIEIFVEVEWSTYVEHKYSFDDGFEDMWFENMEHDITEIEFNVMGTCIDFTDNKEIRNLIVKKISNYE